MVYIQQIIYSHYFHILPLGSDPKGDPSNSSKTIYSYLSTHNKNFYFNLYSCNIQDPSQFFIYGPLLFNCYFKIYRGDHAICDPYHYIALPSQEGFNGTYPKTTGEYPVVTAGSSSSLDMSQNGDPDIISLKLFSYVFGKFENVLATFFPFGNYYNARGFS